MTTYLEAIEASMGDWTYYISKMKFADVVDRVKLAGEIHAAPELDEVIQRKLSDRVVEMKDFLLQNPQRFYGALVVAVYGGNPKFHPVKINEGNPIIDEVNNSFGLLSMDGTQQFFALDGQHRVESIKEACKEDRDLLGDEISVIILKHENTPEGLQRTRRLFTKLNRYAKTTTKSDDITIDEDDVVAIVTRRLIRDNSHLKNKIKIEGKSLNPRVNKDKKYFTVMQILYDCNQLFLEAYDSKIEIDKKFKSTRPTDELIDGMYSYCDAIWSLLFSEIKQLVEISNGLYLPGALRLGDDGGDIWGRPIIHKTVAGVIRQGLTEDKKSLISIVEKLQMLPQTLSEPPWNSILYNATKNTVKQARASDRQLLTDILCDALDVAKVNRSKPQLLEAYQGVIEDSEAKLPVIKKLE
ncbi:MAG: DNA sulfur modification protein DndB [Methylococcaceae bacterium]